MPVAKVRSLVTRPRRSTDLAFEIPGTIEWQNPKFKLGQRVKEAEVVPVDSLTGPLCQRGSNDRCAVLYDATKMQADLGGRALFRMRNHQEFLSLNQAIMQRDHQLLRTYRHRDAIVAAAKANIDAHVKNVEKLKEASKRRYEEIDKAYSSDPDKTWTGVKRAVESVMKSEGQVISDLFIAPLGMKTPAHSINTSTSGANAVQAVADSQTIPVFNNPSDVSKWDILDNTAANASKAREPNFWAQRTAMQEDKNVRRTASQLQEFWFPQLENQIEMLRQDDALNQEELRAKIISLAADHLDEMMRIEFELIEVEIFRNQSKLLSTFLFPPISGIITAIYKDIGEHVQAGEAVLRIEDDRVVYLFGTILHRGALRVGQHARVTARRIFETQQNYSFNAELVSVRGHSADDDEWEIMLEVDNASGVLPLNFNLDSRNTVLEFS